MPAHTDPFDIAGQQVQAEQAAERKKHEARVAIEDLKWVMANKRGRRFVARILDRARIDAISFNTNALQMAFNEGQRVEGIHLKTQAEAACPELYAQMQKERKEDDE